MTACSDGRGEGTRGEYYAVDGEDGRRTVAHHSALGRFLNDAEIWPSCEVVEIKGCAVLWDVEWDRKLRECAFA